jgi:hypothetical protein
MPFDNDKPATWEQDARHLPRESLFVGHTVKCVCNQHDIDGLDNEARYVISVTLDEQAVVHLAGRKPLARELQHVGV